MNVLGWIIQISMMGLLSESVPYLSDPSNLLLRPGNSGQLTCIGSSVRWYSTADDSVAIGNGSKLTVSIPGSYYCQAVHGTTSIRSCPALVSLAEFVPPSDSKDVTRIAHRTNDVILSSCQHVHSVPPASIQWMFNVNQSLPKNTVLLPSGSLLISNFVYKNNLGSYSCIAENVVTNSSWHSPLITLERRSPPNRGNIDFQNTPVNVTGIVGESVFLECAPAGEIDITVKWMPMPSNGQLYNEMYGGVMRIDNVVLGNQGVYNCSYTWTNRKDNNIFSGSRQFYLTVEEHPKVTDLTVTQNSTTALFNCNATGHPVPRIMWNMPPGLTSVAVGTQLIVTPLGPEATGTYQCFVANNIGCDHKEISLNVSSVSIASSSNSSVSVMDTSSVDSPSAAISSTPSSSALILPITSPISSSSVFTGPVSSVVSHAPSSSAFIGPISSVISDTPSSSAVVGPISSIISQSSLTNGFIGPISSVISHAPSVASSYIITSSDIVSTSYASSVSPIYSLASSSTPSYSPSSSISPSYSLISSAISYSPTSSSAPSYSPTSSSALSYSPTSTFIEASSRISLGLTSSSMIIKSDHSSTMTDFTSAATTTASITTIATSISSTTVHMSSSSASPTPSTTTHLIPTLIPTPTVSEPVTMVTGIGFTWVKGDVVKMHWDPVRDKNILGYKISWDTKMIQPPNAAITASNISEFQIPLMENVAKLFIYIWTYNFVGDGPVTSTSIIRPITNLTCENTSISSARVEWTMLAPVSEYSVTAHCSRTGNTMMYTIKDGEISSAASLQMESLEFDCIYAITVKPEGFNDYSLECIIFTGEDNATTGGVREDDDKTALTWIFYIVAFASIVLVVMIVIMTVMMLKHIQIRRREFDKITNHREKIMASLEHESNLTNGQSANGRSANGRSANGAPKYVAV